MSDENDYQQGVSFDVLALLSRRWAFVAASSAVALLGLGLATATCSSTPAPAPSYTCGDAGGVCVTTTDLVSCAMILADSCPTGFTCCTVSQVDAGAASGGDGAAEGGGEAAAGDATGAMERVPRLDGPDPEDAAAGAPGDAAGGARGDAAPGDAGGSDAHPPRVDGAS